jgi:toxin ParE1/3/4
MSILIKPTARTDLKEIRRWSEDNWGRGRTRDYFIGLKLNLEQIARNPQAGRMRPLIAPGLRSFCYKAHVVFYIERDDGISIIRVLHERRNHAALDFSDAMEGDL